MLTSVEAAAVLVEERLSLTAFLRMVVRSRHLAEDLFQEVCVKCLRHTEPFESREHVLNWARLAGKNHGISMLRARTGNYEGFTDEVLETLSAAWPDNSGGRIGERQEMLVQCLKSLTVNNREILRLRYFEGLSGNEVAQRLRRKLPAIHQSLARIYKTLGECVRTKLAVRGNQS